MRVALLVLLIALCGCAEPAGAFVAAEAASVLVFGRGIVDIGVSALSGRDCSIVRLDRGMTYCAPRDSPADRTPFCTRSLGVVDCWADPGLVPGSPRGVADGPEPSAEQQRYRAARWPKTLSAGF